MDIVVLVSIAIALLVIIITLHFMQRRNAKNDKPAHQVQLGHAAPQRVQENIPRRAQILRNQRNRLRQNVASQSTEVAQLDADAQHIANDSDGENAEDRTAHNSVLDEKIGAKKRAKLEAKEQKRLMREQEMQQREQRKLKEEKLEIERKLTEKREAEDELKRIEEERLVREERERKEHEEYLKMKAAFSIEEEGFEEESENENLLTAFVSYIKEHKIVVLEDLATEFKLKTQQVIDRIQDLQTNGTLTGVIDDRGKFIYISEQELAAVAKFIKRRGRVSITELAECSNNFINLAGTI